MSSLLIRFNDVLRGLGSTAAHRGQSTSLDIMNIVAVMSAAAVATAVVEGIQLSASPATRNVGSGGVAIANGTVTLK